MSRPRYRPDPLLESISQVIPDHEINEFFPSNYPGKKGKPFAFTTAQCYRIHLLALLKGVTSFHQLSADLLCQTSYRRFAQLKSVVRVPSAKTLSAFRGELGAEAFALINDLLLERLFSIIPLPAATVAVPDSTDLEASCSGRGKKNALVPGGVPANVNTPPPAPPKGSARKNPDNPNSSWAIKSTPCV